MTYMSGYVPDEETGLGIAPMVVGAVIGGLSSLFGGAHPKDKQRYQRNVWLYNDAIGGHKGDFYQLGVMSGRTPAPEDYDYGPLPDGWTGHVPKGLKGGWATGDTKDDAWKKYQAAKTLLQRSGWVFDSTGLLTAVGPPPPPPPLVTAQVPKPPAGGVQAPTTTAPANTSPTIAMAGLADPKQLVMLAIGGVVLFALSQAGRR